jgi:tRNA modification GTPase
LTAPARGGIAVLRLAGPAAGQILRRIFEPRARPGQCPGAAWAADHVDAGAPVGRLALGWIVRQGQRLDEAIVAQMGSPGVAGFGAFEINIHGGPHVARTVLTLLAQHGAEVLAGQANDPGLVRPAPGLTNPAIAQEMLAALPSALTPLAASALTAQWHAGLSRLARAKPTAQQLRQAAAKLPIMRRLLSPAEVVIAGPPNAGKSALANALAGRNVSVVNELPGTTRDWVRVLAEAEGVPFWLTDTAGLWPEGSAMHEVEQEAVRRAWRRIELADVVICLVSGPLQSGQRELMERLARLPTALGVAGKADLGWQGEALGKGGKSLAVSAVTLAGFAELRAEVRRRLGFVDFDPAAPMAFTRRQAQLLNQAADALEAGEPEDAEKALQELLRWT